MTDMTEEQGTLREVLEEDWKSKPIRTTAKKHTLDSDEEDEGEEKKYEILEDDDIEGQEDGMGGFDGEVQITPFNMKEEMEEGHFDTEGNYHWKKEGKMIRDNWLENIDWVKIKPREGQPLETEESDSEESTPFDTIPTYRKMLQLMKPGESVARALQRLGGKRSMSASERWRRKKAGEGDGAEGDRQQVTDLTEHANRVLTETGNMDVYQETYEHISSLVEEADRKHNAIPKPKSYADALDMYADDFDEKEKARLSDTKQAGSEELAGGSSSKRVLEDSSQPAKKRVRFPDKHTSEDTEDGESPSKRRRAQEPEEASKDKTEEPLPDDQVQWEFKWKEDSTDVNGPHPTKQMQTWVEEGFFKEPVWVRKVGADGPFYLSTRVDFELYL